MHMELARLHTCHNAEQRSNSNDVNSPVHANRSESSGESSVGVDERVWEHESKRQTANSSTLESARVAVC